MNLIQLQNRLIKLTELKEFVNLEIFKDELFNSELEGFDTYVQFNADNYYSNPLYRNDKFEIRLLSWKPSQETVKHTHPENGCIMKILEGKLVEEKFDGNRVSKKSYTKGDVCYTKPNELHILKNSDKDSVSLHIYSPSGFYDVVKQKKNEKKETDKLGTIH